MRILAILSISALFMTTHVFAGTTSLDPQSLAKAILNPQKYAGPTKPGTFSIVYGGQDISRGSINLQSGAGQETYIG